MKTIKVKNIKEFVEILLDMRDDPDYGGNEVQYFGIEIGSFLTMGSFDDVGKFYNDLSFPIKIKNNIISVKLNAEFDTDYDYFLHFEIEENFKKGKYKMLNPYYSPPDGRDDEKSEEEVIEL